MAKTHYAHGPHGNACKRASAKSTTNVHRVDCLACQKSDQFIAAKAEADAQRHEKFMAQIPRNFMEPWQAGKFLLCSSCGNGFFRIGDRTCCGHYDNFHCSKCGHIESRLTERGMSF